MPGAPAPGAVRGARAPRGAARADRRRVGARPPRGTRRRRGVQGAPGGRRDRGPGAEPVRLHQPPRQAGGHAAQRRGDPHRRERRLLQRPLHPRFTRCFSKPMLPCWAMRSLVETAFSFCAFPPCQQRLFWCFSLCVCVCF